MLITLQYVLRPYTNDTYTMDVFDNITIIYHRGSRAKIMEVEGDELVDGNLYKWNKSGNLVLHAVYNEGGRVNEKTYKNDILKSFVDYTTSIETNYHPNGEVRMVFNFTTGECRKYWSNRLLKSSSTIYDYDSIYYEDGSIKQKDNVHYWNNGIVKKEFLAANCSQDRVSMEEFTKGTYKCIKRYKTGIIKCITHLDNKSMHNTTGPAYEAFYSNGNPERIIYLIKGKNHHDNGPASIFYNVDKSIEAESYYKQGLLHRHGKPALINYKNGRIIEELYFIDGEPRRDEGPNLIEYYDNKQVKIKQYGYALEGISSLTYHKNGMIQHKVYYGTKLYIDYYNTGIIKRKQSFVPHTTIINYNTHGLLYKVDHFRQKLKESVILFYKKERITEITYNGKPCYIDDNYKEFQETDHRDYMTVLDNVFKARS